MKPILRRLAEPNRSPPGSTHPRPLHSDQRGGHYPEQRGFTLIEIMVVMVIIAILAAMIVPRVMNRPDQARRLAARQDVASLMQALKLYRLDSGQYPTSDQGLAALVGKPVLDPIPSNWTQNLDVLPKDPWGHPYHYLNPGQHGEIDVWSDGADGHPGGEGNDADIGNWNP